MGGWEEKWRVKLTSAKVEVEVEAELGKINSINHIQASHYQSLDIYFTTALLDFIKLDNTSVTDCLEL